MTPEIRQGDIWLADLGEPVGSVAGFTRPVIIVQGDRVNASRLPTCLVMPLTGNMRLGGLATNLVLKMSETELPQDSVVQPTLLLAVDQSQLIEPVGVLRGRALDRIFEKLDLVLGRK